MIALFQRLTGNTSEKIVRLKSWLLSNGFDFKLVEKDPKTEPVAVKDFCVGSDKILICGNDNLINAVVSATKSLGIPYCIIPDGPGNALANQIGISGLSEERQFILAGFGNPAPIDTWVVNGEHLMISSLMSGMPSLPASIHKEYGDVDYKTDAPNNKRYLCRVVCDDGQIRDDMLIVAVQNTPRVGDGMMVVPEAKCNDGALDVVCVKRALFAKLNVKNAFRGSGLASVRGSISRKSSSVEIKYLEFKSVFVIDGDEFVWDSAVIEKSEQIMVIYNK